MNAPTSAEMHLATLWEALADRLGNAPAVIQGSTTTTWREFEAQASGVAGALQAAGVTADDKVAAYLYNGPEFLETYFAAFKLRAQPVNVNYRYLDAELAYLLDNCDARALVFHSSLAERVDAVDTSELGLLVQVPDTDTPLPIGATSWADATATAPAARRVRGERDHHLLYTGGTTGMPKGVIYEVGGIVTELISMGAPFLGQPAPSSVDGVVEMASAAHLSEKGLVTLVIPPLMHGTGMSLAFLTLTLGGTVVLTDGQQFDPADALASVSKHRVSVVTLVGDAFGRPLVRALDTAAADGRPHDLSSVRLFMSSGAMLAAETKAALVRHAPGAMIIDILAASEASMGSSVSHAGSRAATAAFALRPGTRVLDDQDLDVEPGSGIAGRVAVAATNPIGYYKDTAKTVATFRQISGTRYTFPGDWAQVESDGSITLLGRGSHCITTGGEKVFPEEIEEALKTHTLVTDALVFGVDDDRWGQRIEAVVSTTSHVDAAELIAHVRAGLAAYKAPKAIHAIDTVPRAANGKADYLEARRLAASEAAE